MPSAITPERFATGRTYAEYLAFLTSPENLSRALESGQPRTDMSDVLREKYEQQRLTNDQSETLRWLGVQPGGPAKMLVISEEWSSDCRRDLPTLAHVAEAAGLEMRVFTRDGQKASSAPAADPAERPNADLVNQFLRRRNGDTFQSIPVAAFYDREFNYIWHYLEMPAIYDKQRLVVEHIRGARPGESKEQGTERAAREFGELQASPLFRVWASAAADEIISALHRKVILGEV